MCLPVKPFRILREWESQGLKCAVTQGHHEWGNLCAYVRVPSSHPAYKKQYDDLDIQVHGGLTFSEIEPCAHEDGQGWWFGIDFAHCYDLMVDPAYDRTRLSDSEKQVFDIYNFRGSGRTSFTGEPLHYWTQPEVEKEAEDLACQLAAMVPTLVRMFRSE